jgi:hypothetical protein
MVKHCLECCNCDIHKIKILGDVTQILWHALLYICGSVCVCGHLCGYDGVYMGGWVRWIGDADLDVIYTPARLAGL